MNRREKRADVGYDMKEQEVEETEQKEECGRLGLEKRVSSRKDNVKVGGGERGRRVRVLRAETKVIR